MDHTALNVDWRVDDPVRWVRDHVTFPSPTQMVISVGDDTLRLSARTSGRLEGFLQTLIRDHTHARNVGRHPDDLGPDLSPPPIPTMSGQRPRTRPQAPHLDRNGVLQTVDADQVLYERLTAALTTQRILSEPHRQMARDILSTFTASNSLDTTVYNRWATLIYNWLAEHTRLSDPPVQARRAALQRVDDRLARYGVPTRTSRLSSTDPLPSASDAVFFDDPAAARQTIALEDLDVVDGEGPLR